MSRHYTTNGVMVLAKSAPDLMQRLPRLPTSPHVNLLLRGKPVPSPWSHKHHLYTADLHQMVLHRPFETATQTGKLAPGENRPTRVRMEGWRQRRLGGSEKSKSVRYLPLTRTGLLMEGPWPAQEIPPSLKRVKVIVFATDIQNTIAHDRRCVDSLLEVIDRFWLTRLQIEKPDFPVKIADRNRSTSYDRR